MVGIIAGDRLEIQLKLNPEEIKNEVIILEDHCLITPENFEFRVINNKNFNFKYRGRVWLLEKSLIFHGFEITTLKLQEDVLNSENRKIICKLDYSDPIRIEVNLKEVEEVYVGHDEIFRERYFKYPKLRITCEIKGADKKYYLIFADENLLMNEDRIKERLNRWREELVKRIPTKISDRPIELLDETEVISELSDILDDGDELKLEEIPVSSKPPEPNISVQKESIREIETPVKAQESESPFASPIPIKKKDKPIIGRVTIESDEDVYTVRKKPLEIPEVLVPDKIETDDDTDKNVLYDVLKPAESIDDTFKELTDIKPDSSINRCKKCGWIIRYDQLKCPRCGADTLY
ncbi:MAG: hypothetical protein ACTSPY_16285 [Candidatus Helarchaeota archaeon]